MSKKPKKSKTKARKEKLTAEGRELMEIIGTNVKRLREARGWAQADVENYGFSERYWQHMEYGNKNLSGDNIARVAKVLGVEVSELVKKRKSKATMA